MIPTALAEKPDLWPENAENWIAFMALHSARPAGMGPGAIPIVDIEAYARLSGHPEPMRLLSDVQALDRVWLRWVAERNERARADRGR